MQIYHEYLTLLVKGTETGEISIFAEIHHPHGREVSAVWQTYRDYGYTEGPLSLG
jgi:hypothetical protein